jgi:hypothetical protein
MMRLILAPNPRKKSKKNPSNHKVKNRAKNTSEKHKNKKTLQLNIGDYLTQTHGCIDTNEEFIRCRNHPNILPLFERLGRSLTSLLSFLRHEAHPHLSKIKT